MPVHSRDVQGMVIEQDVCVSCFRVIIGYCGGDNLDIWHWAKALHETIYIYGRIGVLSNIDSISKATSVTVGV